MGGRFDGTSIGRITSSKVSSANSTGVTGVHRIKRSGKYEAYLYLRKKKIYLGIFDTKNDAITARERAVEMYYTPIVNRFMMEANG